MPYWLCRVVREEKGVIARRVWSTAVLSTVMFGAEANHRALYEAQQPRRQHKEGLLRTVRRRDGPYQIRGGDNGPTTIGG